ncbi:sodium:solute symporter [Phaeocystidibacter luteus]|uniref:Sodium:solute symporter n=1 Tax=Phaeocystidibacter luteus TaxID=911197 RepID=A0A6N6RM07_9FLAO|nr:sodium:solute symporter [Phaeocystidibacter luteus]KAB2814654.1 sodium:solute symporter [Phaeocystidibacter luteus]
MHLVDWLVLGGTLVLIVLFGIYKSRNQNLNGFLRGEEMSWSTIGLSIMATQASAITFLSTPGQAYEDGMGFVQFYFGLPIAIVIICAFFLPIYYKLKVYTAYEYLEGRFDLRTRLLTALLFLVSRGLAAGITIYAPAIILSKIMQWNLQMTILIVGILVVLYTVSGGTKAVSMTQRWQMTIILAGMVLAFGIIVWKLPDSMSFTDSIDLAGVLGKMEIINTDLDFENRYTIWSGLTGGLFLALSYFGTDQSQVQRYLGGKSLKESRIGLIFNGLFKVPMQFFILLVGVMVFIFYQVNIPPVVFNTAGIEKAEEMGFGGQVEIHEERFRDIQMQKQEAVAKWLNADAAHRMEYEEDILHFDHAAEIERREMKRFLERVDEDIETEDSDYIFLTFIMDHMPIGIVGLLLAVILSAAMSSTAGELNALASTTVVDFYNRLRSPKSEDEEEEEINEAATLSVSKLFTALWGMLAIVIALSAQLVDNLIELVNILGSLFYGTILGIFLIAFFFKKIKAKALFPAAVIAELTVLTVHILNVMDVIELGYLMYNVIGCGVVIGLAILLHMTISSELNDPIEE